MVFVQALSGRYAGVVWCPLFARRVVFAQAPRGLLAGAASLLSESMKIPTVLVVLVVPSISVWALCLVLWVHVAVPLL